MQKANFFIIFIILMQKSSLLPVVFIGHGSPENAILDNEFTREWFNISTSFEKPKAILCISAHWQSEGIEITSSPNPEIVLIFMDSRMNFTKYHIRAKDQLNWLN